MLYHTIAILSVLFGIFSTINGEACSSNLCDNPETQKCCSATLNGSQYQVHCCAKQQTCCGSTCADVCCDGVSCPAGYSCCGGGRCCAQGSSCCGASCCANKCCNNGRCVNWGTACEGITPPKKCLFGNDFVSLQDGSQKQLKYLRSGDKIYSVDNQGQIVKDEIIMILHGGTQNEVPFYTITTSSNQSISLTGDHSIMTYSSSKKRSVMVAANELKVNDYLLMAGINSQNVSPVSIISIEILYKTGFITPMTYTGKLLVNGIVTSCYVKHHNIYNEMHAVLYPFRLYYYLVKDIFRLTDEPFSTRMYAKSFDAENEYYGHTLVRSMHQSKAILKYLVQHLIVHTLSNI